MLYQECLSCGSLPKERTTVPSKQRNLVLSVSPLVVWLKREVQCFLVELKLIPVIKKKKVLSSGAKILSYGH